jgi:hypothetical protein
MGQFDKRSSERIARAVGYVEGVLKGGGSGRAGAAVFPPLGFWAKITDTDNDGKYSWQAQLVNDDGTLADDTDGASGDYTEDTGYAVEVLWGSAAVLLNSIVWLYPAMSQDFLLFQYTPSGAVIEAGGEMAAGSWSSPTSGEGIVQKWNGSGFVPADDNVTIYNPFNSVIHADTKLQCLYVDGIWLANAEDCST